MGSLRRHPIVRAVVADLLASAIGSSVFHVPSCEMPWGEPSVMGYPRTFNDWDEVFPMRPAL